MSTEEPDEDPMFSELEELVALEVKDILATATEEGVAPRDVVTALELELQAQIEALATNMQVGTDAGKGDA